MYWILQNNIFSETGWDSLIENLQRFNIPYSEHKVIPFIGELDPEPKLDTKNIICFGSYSMRHIAKKNKWNPGVFDLFEQNFEVQKEHWEDRLLNFDSEVLPFKDVYFKTPKFIRPIDDSKYFAGKVFDSNEFQEWQDRVCDLDEDYGTSLSPDTLVQMSTPREIYSEYRFWIVKRKIVTASLYKRGSRVVYSNDVDQKFYQYAIELVQGWVPEDAFCLDLCDTPDGIKIVEINTINAAGFYAADVQKLIMVLEENFNGN